jgi:predicted transposase YbfD/YdcC
MRRNAATPIGLRRRLRELAFEKVQDPREVHKVDYPLPTVLTALVAAMVTKARSLRVVEQRTEQMARKAGAWLGVKERIADNTFGKVLPRLALDDLLGCQHRLIKAEHRRGNLKPTRLPQGTVAIDGKNVATLHWHDLCRLLDLDRHDATFEQLKALLAERYPQAQLCQSDSAMPYALLRVHTVTLISSAAAVCVHQRPVPGHTNENGALPDLLEELKAVYGRSRLFGLLTTDAGNTSLGAASQIVEAGWHYFAQIKSVQGELHAEAKRVLARRRQARAHASYSDTQNGQLVTYHLWRDDLSQHGWLNWTHARQLVRIQRMATDPATGEVISLGNRYYVTSLPVDAMTPQQALATSRAHWRCENETHWTDDAELAEDRRRHAWSRHPHGLLAVSVIRTMALAILAVARRLSRFGHSCETPSWTQVAEHFLLQLCGSILQTEAFDIV